MDEVHPMNTDDGRAWDPIGLKVCSSVPLVRSSPEDLISNFTLLTDSVDVCIYGSFMMLDLFNV